MTPSSAVERFVQISMIFDLISYFIVVGSMFNKEGCDFCVGFCQLDCPTCAGNVVVKLESTVPFFVMVLLVVLGDDLDQGERVL